MFDLYTSWYTVFIVVVGDSVSLFRHWKGQIIFMKFVIDSLIFVTSHRINRCGELRKREYVDVSHNNRQGQNLKIVIMELTTEPFVIATDVV